MKTILVTGCSGFIGSVLTIELLKKGYKVVGIDNLSRGPSQLLINAFDSYPNLHIYYGSIMNKPLVEWIIKKHEPNYIAHLAGIVGEPACAREPDLAYQLNVVGTKVICDLKSDETILWLSSTGSVYGKLSTHCTEEVEPNPISHYSITKLESEKITLSYPNTFLYRFSTLFGNSGNSRINLLLNNMVYDAVNYKALTIFQADFKRSFIHILDAVHAIIFGLENFNRMEHRIYNCGNHDGNWTKREAAEFIRSKTNCLVTYADEAKYSDTDQRNYYVSSQRLYDLGWRPQISMEDGVNNLIRSAQMVKARYVND